MNRRGFLKRVGLALGALPLAPFALKALAAEAAPLPLDDDLYDEAYTGEVATFGNTTEYVDGAWGPLLLGPTSGWCDVPGNTIVTSYVKPFKGDLYETITVGTATHTVGIEYWTGSDWSRVGGS